MTDSPVLNPHPREFERFLYASVGEDRNGYIVTVLSALARLGLDPWNETADLVSLGRDGARARLGALLARFRDVPELASDHGRIARHLSQLLPESRPSGSLKRAVTTAAEGSPGKSAAILPVLGILFVLFQIFMVGGSGSGE
ncbi:hypothetical protein [Oceanicola sp. 502str15]|uniref:hypothetical protein n=1 Tax=Oceanicola sp. 502str15 TaxID=2696061 RepID=UPI0020958A2A|nr:hypothetical protein [Oceanicola sp. 502str15]MCO6381410.1 hypothetical protein [Oceanicola sp. 502str15]